MAQKKSQNTPEERANEISSAQQNQASLGFTVGSVYLATVVDADISTRTVTVYSHGVKFQHCQLAAAVFTDTVGVDMVLLPPVGSRVLMIYFPTKSYVIGLGPSIVEASAGGEADAWNPPVTGDEEYDVLDKANCIRTKNSDETVPASAGYKLPIDMLPGELEISTGIGPAIRLLLNFAQMTSGSLAKIETHLLNDMVRIVDNYFAHHNVGGDTLIWSNGKCTYEDHFTPHPHEAEGKKDEKEKFAESLDEGAYSPKQSLEQPDMTASHTGRWRKSTYVGFLGDMIHTWITNPTEVASTYMEDAFRTGNLRQWMGTDGTYMLQAAGGVHIEVSQNILIPVIKKAWNDPSLTNIEQAMKSLDSQYLKLWGKGSDWKDLKTAVWQMRAWSRYMTMWHSLARFRQMVKTQMVEIPKLSDQKEYTPTADEKDREQANSGATSYKSFGCISIDPSGSIAIVAGNDTSIILNQGNVQISCPGNIELQAGNTVSIKGKSVAIHAARNLELMSFFDGVFIKARTVLNALCEKGRIWLKSDAEKDKTEPGDCPLEDKPTESQMKKNGIILDAPQSSVLVHGAEGVTLGTMNEESKITLEANGPKSDVNIIAMQDVNVRSNREFKLKTIKAGIGSIFTKFAGFVTKFGDQVLFRGGLLDLDGMIRTRAVISTGGYIGPSEMNGKDPNPPEPEPSKDTEELDEVGDKAKNLETKDISSNYRDEEFQDLNWELPEWKVGEEPDQWDSLKAGAFDDLMNLGDEELSSEFDEVTVFDTMLLGAIRTKPTNMPWPGKEGKKLTFMDTSLPKLTDPMENDFSAGNIPDASKLSPMPYKIYTRK